MQADNPVTADVLVFLSGVGGDRHFTVENEGPAAARNVELRIESEGDKNTPVLESELEKKFPIAELGAGEQLSVQAIITTGTGIHFKAVVSWQNPDGSRREVNARLTP
ncbi:MAG: hypothetical protein WBP10_11225 [Thermoanaerobaculia bacterium]|jgi:hypothetical protein